MQKKLMGGASVSAFASLLSFGKRRAEDEDDDHRDEAARAADGDDHDDEDDSKESKKSKKAKSKAEDGDEDDTEDKDAEEPDSDDDEDDSKESKKSKKAKAKADDEDCEDEDDDDYAKGRKAERARWARVLKSPAATGGRVVAACELLANSDLPAKAVISTLTALPTASRSGLADRMASVQSPQLGPDGGDAPRADGPKGLAAKILDAGKKRRGEA